MHDAENGRSHAAVPHKVYTPNTRHIENIKQVVRQEALLTGQSSRKAVESQVLQNPLLLKIESVAGELVSFTFFFL